jgi:hypothetical protein
MIAPAAPANRSFRGASINSSFTVESAVKATCRLLVRPSRHRRIAMPHRPSTAVSIDSGGEGIRTPGTFRYGGFQNRCLRPLGHSSMYLFGRENLHYGSARVNLPLWAVATLCSRRRPRRYVVRRSVRVALRRTQSNDGMETLRVSRDSLSGHCEGR